MALDARTLLRWSRSAGRLLRHLSPLPGRPPAASPSASRRGPLGARFTYAPHPDGKPDPGEIVWAWVPYEDDPAQGKDRPVLLIGRERRQLLGLAMTSRDRNNGQVSDSRYVDIGSGPWDSEGRPSEVRVDRILRIEPSAIRRNGAVLPRPAFDAVIKRMPRR